MKQMEKNIKPGGEKIWEDDLGLMLWKLQSLEEFYPVYKTMIKKE